MENETTIYKIITEYQEREEDFIFNTILPFTQEVLERKINKEELKKIIIQGTRKGKWIIHPESKSRECSYCRVWLNEFMPRNSYCPNCGANMYDEGE